MEAELRQRIEQLEKHQRTMQYLMLIDIGINSMKMYMYYCRDSTLKLLMNQKIKVCFEKKCNIFCD